MKKLSPAYMLKKALSNRSQVKRLAILLLGITLFTVGGTYLLHSARGAVTQTGNDLWQQTAETAELSRQVQAIRPINYRLFKLNREALSQLLGNAPREFTQAAKGSAIVLPLPLPDGTFIQFRIEESPSMAPELEASHSEIKSYRGQAIDHPATTMRCDLSPRGFHALIISNEGAITIHPTRWDQATTYISYQGQDLKQFRCDVNESMYANPGSTIPLFSNGQNLRTYRLALATTQEYTNDPQLGGGTVAGAIAALNTTVNAMNVIYERELAIHLNMVTDNALIYTQEPDGFTNGNTDAMIDEVPPKLVQVLGTANFDLGHVLGTNSGGLAGLGVVCDSGTNQNGVLKKGRGASGQAGPAGSFGDVNLWAHEIGHQFGAQHTFNGTLNSCSGGNRSQTTSWETGSGNTIMAYEGICGADNIGYDQGRFHVGSLTQILNYLSAGTGASCGIPTNTNNTPPTVSGGPDRTIPKNTPFALTAIGADPDVNDLPNLTYTWDQYDIGGANFFQDGTEASYNDAADPPTTTRPIFRPLLPTASPIRLFPSLNYILNNANDPPLNDMNGKKTAEELPRIGRSLNFRVTVRDNRAMGGGINDDLVTLTVDGNSGPFQVTAPNGGENWTVGSMQNITWNVNNTNNAPVSCTNVRISLSIDGGQTFPFVLAASTPNDGNEAINIPNVADTTMARIKVEAVGNIFFDISNANFNITGGGPIACPNINGLNPMNGQIGFKVTITGTNFNGVTAVKFSNNVNALFSIDSDTQITATVPSGAVTGPITISRPTCNDVQSADFTVDAITCPNINGFAPMTQQPGQAVTITGTGFTGVSIVKFNNEGAIFTVDNDTQITAIVPAGATPGPISLSKAGCQTAQTANFTPCNVPQTLRVDDGSAETASGSAGQNFSINRLTPIGYPATLTSISIEFDQFQQIPQGTNITVLAGTNTDGDNNIDNTVFQMVPAQVGTLEQFTSYNLITPLVINSGDFVVGFSINTAGGQFAYLKDTSSPQGRSYSSADGTSFSLIANNYNLLIRGQYSVGCTGGGPTCPTVNNINPSNGQVGSQVVITGTNFTGVTGVKFSNNVTALFTVDNATQITATVPNGAVTGPITISKTGCGDVQTATFTVNTGCPTITISPAMLPAGTLNSPYNQSLMASGGTGPYSFSLTAGNNVVTRFDATGPVAIPDNNPAGIDLPVTVMGLTSSITKVTASVHITHTYDQDLTLQLIGPDGTTVNLSNGRGNDGDNYGTACAPDGQRTLFDDAAVTAISAGAAPFVGSFKPEQMLSAFNGKSGAAVNGSWKLHVVDGADQDTGSIQCVSIFITQTLPAPGLSLAANGTLSGTPTTQGIFNFTVKATDQNACMGTLAYSLTINGGCPTITVNPANPTLPAGTMGTPYTQTFTQMGGAGAIVWSSPAGVLPGGMMLNPVTGELSGTPTGQGNFNFTIRATDANTCTGERMYNLVINPMGCPTITVNPANAANGTVGTAYSQTFTQVGGAGTIAWSSTGNLPPGLMLNAMTGELAGNPTNVGPFTFTIRATDANNCFGERQYTVIISGSGLMYYPLPKPIRLFDTRAPIPGFPACAYLNQPLVANGELIRNARITCDGVTIPANAAAIVGNATVITPATAGFITLWPDGQARPPVSNLNFSAGQVVPNAFTVGLSGAGDFRVYSTSNADFALDVTGYFAPPSVNGLYYHPLPKPIRLFDTRAAIPGFPACEYLNQPLVAGGELIKQARITCDGITIPADALAIVGNATVVSASNNGFITLWPEDQARPPVSNLNYVTGQVVPNAFTVGLGADGRFRVFSVADTNFIVDITGYYSPSANDANGAGLLYSPLSKPIRLFDTRATIPGFPACQYLNQALVANGELVKTAHITCDGITIPTTATAIVGNATAVQPLANGFITLWPDGQMRPPVSNLNYVAGQVVPNAFTVGLNTSGNFRIYSFADTHFIVDVTGYYAP